MTSQKKLKLLPRQKETKKNRRFEARIHAATTNLTPKRERFIFGVPKKSNSTSSRDHKVRPSTNHQTKPKKHREGFST